MVSNGSNTDQNFQIDNEFADMENQVIYTDGYMRYDENGEKIKNADFENKFNKKKNSFFTRTNPYYGNCKRCNYEICMQCGLDFHTDKNCKNQMDQAMKEYFKGVDPGSITNCPKCGMIVEKEVGGCNHITCSKCNY